MLRVPIFILQLKMLYGPIRLVDFLISNISKSNEQILLIFGMQRAVRRKILQLVGWVRSDIPRYAQSSPKAKIFGNLEIVVIIFAKSWHKWSKTDNFLIEVKGPKYYIPIKLYRLQYSMRRNISRRKRMMIFVLWVTE